MHSHFMHRGSHGGHHFGSEHGARGHGIRPDFPFGDFAGGGGGRRERIFASGDLKFAVLHLINQKPGHGYEVIKALGELVGGDYSPSPGTIYPTLAMLEDLGWIIASQQEGGRKEYRISPEGAAQLQAQRDAVERILDHLGHVKSRAHARRAPEVMRAMENLKMALKMRLGRGDPDPEAIRRISEIIDRAAVDIERC